MMSRTCRSVSRIMVAAAVALAAMAPASAERLIGFHAPWDPASASTLRAHGGELSIVVAARLSVTGADHMMTIVPDDAGRAALAALPKAPRLWLMVQNALLGTWDGAGAAALLRDPAANDRFLDALGAQLLNDGARGAVVDFENLPADAQPDLVSFLAKAHARFRQRGWTLAVAAPVSDPAWNLSLIGASADAVILMAYDEHWQTGTPGPIASTSWFQAIVRKAVGQLPRGRAIVALASYAYDWPAHGPAAILSVEQARAVAARHAVQPIRDTVSGATHFSYDLNDEAHQVWIADASTVAAQAALAHGLGVDRIALWRLGTEDDRLWASFEAH